MPPRREREPLSTPPFPSAGLAAAPAPASHRLRLDDPARGQVDNAVLTLLVVVSLPGVGVECGFQFRDPCLVGVEPVLQLDDTGGRIQGHSLVEQLPHPGGQLHLAARVPTMPAAGTLRCEYPRRVQAAQERQLLPQQLGWPAPS